MSGGGALGLGKQKTDSQSTSDSFGISNSMSQDVSASSGSTTQGIAFEDLFKQLYSGAGAAAGAAAASAPEIASAAKQLFTGGSNFLQGLGLDSGTGYLEDRLSSDNPVLEQQIAGLREDTGRLFTEQFNPAITSEAVAGGNLGGGRQGVAQGAAMDTLARQFTQGAVALRANDISQRDSVAAQVASGSLAAAGTGLGALPGLMDVLTSSNETGLAPYSALASIMGGPTVLSQSTSQSAAQAFSKAFGQQGSTTQSTSRGRGWNFSASGYGGVG